MTEKKFLNAQDILKRKAPAPKAFYVPEWDGYVYLKTLTVKERDSIEKAAVNKRTGQVDIAGLRNRVLIKAVVTAEGLPMFSIHDVKDLEALDSKGVSRVAAKAMRMCGLEDADLDDEAEGFDEAPGDDASTD